MLAAPLSFLLPTKSAWSPHASFLHWGSLPWGVFRVSTPPEFSAYIQVPRGRLAYSCTLLGEGTGAWWRREARKGQKGSVPFRFQTVTQSAAPGGWAAGLEAPFSGVAAPSLPVLRNSPGWALPGLWREAGDLWGLCRDVSALSSVCFMQAVTPVTPLECLCPPHPPPSPFILWTPHP